MFLKQFYRYGVVGILSSGLYLLLIHILIDIFKFGNIVAASIAYLVGTVVSYTGNTYWAFENRHHYTKALKFLIIVLISFLLNITITAILSSVGMHYLLTGMVVIVLVPIFNFFCHKYWTYED